MILKKNFYERNTLKVAKDLLGCFLVRKINGKIIRAMITETEAYMGEDDLASHASRGRTPRTEIMFGEAGRTYIYMIYGIHHCLNVVTEKKDFPAAVLIRAVKIEDIDYRKTNGPGKVCKILDIDRKINDCDMTRKEKLWIEKPAKKVSKKHVAVGRRIGIDYAKHCREYPWRFYLVDYKKNK